MKNFLKAIGISSISLLFIISMVSVGFILFIDKNLDVNLRHVDIPKDYTLTTTTYPHNEGFTDIVRLIPDNDTIGIVLELEHNTETTLLEMLTTDVSSFGPNLKSNRDRLKLAIEFIHNSSVKSISTTDRKSMEYYHYELTRLFEPHGIKSFVADKGELKSFHSEKTPMFLHANLFTFFLLTSVLTLYLIRVVSRSDSTRAVISVLATGGIGLAIIATNVSIFGTYISATLTLFCIFAVYKSIKISIPSISS